MTRPQPRTLAGRRVTVAGLGRFGGQIAAARWLIGQGATVVVTDKDSPDKLADSLRQLDGLPIIFHLGKHDEIDFTQTDLVVASPAIPPTSQYLQAAARAGVPVTTEICLFIERCPAQIYAVTGTKGKSTTTAMLHRMVSVRHRCHLGGNIGKSLLENLPAISPDDRVVLELSSYMLHYLGERQWSPHVGVITMLARDHSEWHGSHEAYLAAKQMIWQNQAATDFAVVNSDDPLSGTFAAALRSRVIHFSAAGRQLHLRIPGAHNQLNAQAAFAAASVAGITFDEAQSAVADFPGLPHRLELVHEQGGIRWFNDSIATIPQAAIAALEAFASGTVIQIVGGSNKHLDNTALAAVLAGRAKATLAIGEIGPSIIDLIRAAAPSATAEYRIDLAAAVARARQIARPGDVVLLSPATASYDQFPNFEKRGEFFARLARQ